MTSLLTEKMNYTATFLPKDLINEIIQYTIEDKYVLHDWMPEKYLNIVNIAANPLGVEYAINILNKINKIRTDVLAIDVSNEYKANTDEERLYIRRELLRDAIEQSGLCISNYVNPDLSLAEEKGIIGGLCMNHNPSAIEFIKNNLSLLDSFIIAHNLCQNPLAADIIINDISHSTEIYYKYWMCLNKSPKIINYLKNNIHFIQWAPLSDNEEAIEILSTNLDKLDDECWQNISKNSKAIDLIKYAIKNKPHVIVWPILCYNDNPDIFPIISENIDKLDNECWINLSGNPGLIGFIKNDKKMMDLMINAMNQYVYEFEDDGNGWQYLAQNPNAIDIIESNINKIELYYLSMNESPEAVEILKRRIDEFDDRIWHNLSQNPHAIELIRANKDKMEPYIWKKLSMHEGIFKNIRSDICSKVMRLCYL